MPSSCWRRIARRHIAETEYYLGKGYVQNGQARTGAEILQRVYYDYATNYLADEAEADLRRMPEELAASGHLRRASQAGRRALQGATLSRAAR